MDVREKLVELLNNANSACVGTDCFEGCKFYMENDCLYKLMADVMIENGVTVQEFCHKAESVISQTGLMCTACHSDIDRDAEFCKYCGAKVMPQPPKGE